MSDRYLWGGIALGGGALVAYLRNRMICQAEAELGKTSRALDAGSLSHTAYKGSMAIIMGVLPDTLYIKSTTYKEVFQWSRFLKSCLGIGSSNEADWTQIPVASSVVQDDPLAIVTEGPNGNHGPTVLRLNRPASELAKDYPEALMTSTREESVSADSMVRPEGGRFTKTVSLAKATAVTLMARVYYSSEKGWYVPAMEPVKWLASSSLRDQIRTAKATSALSKIPDMAIKVAGMAGIGLMICSLARRYQQAR